MKRSVQFGVGTALAAALAMAWLFAGVAHVAAQDTSSVNQATVGPPAPTASAQQPAAVRKPADVPEPTVVLKPGEVPGIQFDTPTYDFGRIKAGPEVAHDFWFVNTGTGPLEILKVRPG